MIGQIQHELASSLSQLKAQFILQINFIHWSKKEKLQILMLLSTIFGCVCICGVFKQSVHLSANICIAFKTTETIWSYIKMWGEIARIWGMVLGRAVCAWVLAEVYLPSVVLQPATISAALLLMERSTVVHAKNHVGVSFVWQYRLSINNLNLVSLQTYFFIFYFFFSVCVELKVGSKILLKRKEMFFSPHTSFIYLFK